MEVIRWLITPDLTEFKLLRGRKKALVVGIANEKLDRLGMRQGLLPARGGVGRNLSER